MLTKSKPKVLLFLRRKRGCSSVCQQQLGCCLIGKLNETYLQVEVWLKFYRGICRNEEVTWDSKHVLSELSLESSLVWLWCHSKGGHYKEREGPGMGGMWPPHSCKCHGRISIKLQLTGKSRLIFQFYLAFAYNRRSLEISKLKATANEQA